MDNSNYTVIEHSEKNLERAASFIKWRRRILNILLVITASLGLIEAGMQYREDRYVHQLALQIVQSANAKTPRDKVLALRDYIRTHVTYLSAPYFDRSFFRSTTKQTLESGLGYCGEVTRAFINLADSVGIRSQRINLWGAAPHVVAEAELGPRDLVVVDCQYPPSIKDLERLDQVILRPEWDDYYTLNLRRLHISWLVSRVKMEMGPFTYWTENPHALKALLWFGFCLIVMGIRFGRDLLRYLLRRRGWVHISEVHALKRMTK